MASLFDTNTLILTVPDLLARNPVQFLLNLAFKQKAVSDREFVTVDITKGRRIVAPLVLPSVPGHIMQARATESREIRPAYVKPKFPINPSETIKRLAGESLNGTLSPQQRLQVLVMNRLQDGLAYCQRRMEVMAADCLVNGTVTLVGDKYPRTVVDFQRTAAHTGIVPSILWTANGNVPLEDLDTTNSLMIQDSGLGATDVIFDPKSWKLFRKNSDVKALLQNFPGQQNAVQVNQGGLGAEGGQFMGQVGEYRLWQYQSFYIDPADNTQKSLLPDYAVIMVNADGVAGVQHFGAIQDVESLVATEYFPKVWDEQDPSMRYAMIQSAPLVSIERPDASAVMIVG